MIVARAGKDYALETISLSGKLDESHHKGHVPLQFQVPAGTTRLSGKLTVTPKRAAGALFDNLISIAVDSPAGPRGARHNNDDMSFSFDAGNASPGFVPGAIDAGRWIFWLDVFRLIGTVAYTLEIECHAAPLPAVSRPPARAPADRGPGWYRGDLHAHTLHSDGSWDVAELAAFARVQRLDFLALTDHNTVSGVAGMERVASDLLVLGGLELTTHYGHALVLGTRTNEPWRAKSWPGLTMPELAAARMAEGKTFVIAHPRAPGDPSCTGCRWDYADMQPGPARLVEVWNGPWSDANEEGLALYREWLTEAWRGHRQRLYVTAGTDSHGPWRDTARLGFNTVFAETFTESGVLDAVRSGRNVLSAGPKLHILVETPDTATRLPGVSTGSGPVRLTAEAEDAPEGAILQLVSAEGPLRRGTEWTWDGGRTDWSMVELRAAGGELLALSNPIFIG